MDNDFKSKTPFRDKLEKELEPRIVEIPAKWYKSMGTGSMVIPTPLLIESLIKKIPKGKLTTIKLIREKLARDFNTDTASPIDTQTYLKIIADAVEEDLESGKKDVSPYWRVLKDDGSLNPKLHDGIKFQYKHLADEDFEFITAESKHVIKVRYYDKVLFDFS